MTTSADDTEAREASGHRADIAVAVRNAIKLGMSLIATWTLALIVRFQLPRHLGPVSFGHFNFADSFAASFFVFAGFGIETYIQKEVSARPRHASDFFGGVVLTRLALSLLLTVAMIAVLAATGRSAELRWVGLVFALTQAVTALNATLSAMLQASTKVGALAIVNVASKLVWGLGLTGCIALNMPLVALAVPALISELIRTVVLWRTARKELSLEWHVRFDEVVTVLRKSFPYYVNGVAITLGAKLDVSVLEFQASGPEVGWYSAASNLAGLAMLLSPLFGWVLMPLLSRARARSEEDFFLILRRALEGFLVVAVPVTLLIALGADLWVRIAFGANFEPAAVSLRLLAPMFIATYLAMILAICLILSNRSWRLTTISLIGVSAQPLLSLLLVPITRRFGEGYAGAGAASALIGQELLVSALMLVTIGQRAVDRRAAAAIGKSLLIAAAVVALDRWMLRLGYVRLVLDMLAYAALAFATRTLRPTDILAFVKIVRTRSPEPAAQ